MEEDIKSRQDKLGVDRAKIDAVEEKRKADMKAFNEMMARSEVERKADFEKMTKGKADREVAARLKAIHDKTDTNQMRLEPETEHQEKMDAWIVGPNDGQKESMACQQATEANPEKMEPNPGEK
jgi:hypothetical protein